MTKSALIVGASGIAGSNLATELLSQGWTVYGLARGAKDDGSGMIPVAADLRDPASLQAALADIAPTNVFITAWLRQDTEQENIRVNAGMVKNVLDALSPKKSVRHVSLVTGLKHYLGPFDAYASSGTLPQTPLREDQPRLDLDNFYYAQEDEVYAAAARDGFHWNVHRPHTLIGKAVGNAMNMGSTLAVYASICKQTGRAVPVSRFAAAVARPVGRDRRAPAGQAAGVGRRHRGRAQYRLQHRQRRHLQMAVAVGAHRHLVRRRGARLRRRHSPPGSGDGEVRRLVGARWRRSTAWWRAT